MVTSLSRRKAVIAKLGFDAHWRGAIMICHALRNAGMEVVYLGHSTPGQIIQTAIQEDVHLVGLSTLSGNHIDECPPIASGLRAATGRETVLVLGGTIPQAHVPVLLGMGIDAVFPTGTPLSTIVGQIGDLVAQAEARRTGTA